MLNTQITTPSLQMMANTASSLESRFITEACCTYLDTDGQTWSKHNIHWWSCWPCTSGTSWTNALLYTTEQLYADFRFISIPFILIIIILQLYHKCKFHSSARVNSGEIPLMQKTSDCGRFKLPSFIIQGEELWQGETKKFGPISSENIMQLHSNV